MSKIRDMLKHVSVETARRKRTSNQNSKDIVMNEHYLVVKTGAMN